jgi:hypothetical protein
LEFTTACRLIAAELQDAQHTVKFALDKKHWWRPDDEPKAEAWTQYNHLLAPHLSYEAWSDVRLAVHDLNKTNVLATGPRPADKTEEIFLEETVNALNLLTKGIQKGYAALTPHLL